MAEQVEKKKKGGILKFIIIFFVIIIVLIGVFVALLKFDVAGLGSEIIGPSIKDIPGASLILPEMPEEEMLDENGQVIEGNLSEDATVQYETMEQAVEILKVTENLLKEKEEEAEKLSEEIAQLQLENARLKVFEDNYLEYEADKAAFDELIVEGTDPASFSTWYATMNPDNAANIYALVIGEEALDAEMQDLVSTFSEMKPDAAATILSELGATRLEEVAMIIQQLESDDSAKILAAMDATLAARITVYLYPEQ